MSYIQCPCCDKLSATEFHSADNSNNKWMINVQPLINGCYAETVFRNQKLYICSNCTFAFSFPYLDSEGLSHFYSKQWLNTRIEQMILSSCLDFQPNLFVLQRLFRVLQFQDASTPFTFLDFGGSDGVVAEHVSKLFPNSFSYVSDSQQYNECWINRGIKYRDLNDFADESIDVFYSAHCLEHFNANELQGLIKTISKKVKKGGLIYIEVPNENFSNYKNNIKYISGPHLSHFNYKSMLELIDGCFECIALEVRGIANRYGIVEETTGIKQFKFKANLRDFLKKYLRKFSLFRYGWNLFRRIRNKSLFQIQEFSEYGYFNLNPDGDLLVLVAKNVKKVK